MGNILNQIGAYLGRVFTLALHPNGWTSGLNITMALVCLAVAWMMRTDRIHEPVFPRFSAALFFSGFSALVFLTRFGPWLRGWVLQPLRWLSHFADGWLSTTTYAGIVIAAALIAVYKFATDLDLHAPGKLLRNPFKKSGGGLKGMKALKGLKIPGLGGGGSSVDRLTYVSAAVIPLLLPGVPGVVGQMLVSAASVVANVPAATIVAGFG